MYNNITTTIDLDLNKIKLNFIQCAILKTCAIGKSEIEIQRLLEIDQIAYDNNLHELFDKFQTTNFYDIVKLSLLNNQLSRYDFVKDTVKKIAIKYSKSIFDNLNSSSLYGNNRNLMNRMLSHFIIDIHKSFINEASYNELTPLKMEYLEFFKAGLKNSKMIAEEEVNPIQRKIIDKFKSNNYFNATRRIFELNLVSKSIINPEYESCNKKLQITTGQKIESVFFIDKYSDKERQLCIYFDLINYYNKLEDKLLFDLDDCK